jgi:large subunit ribosomal protein L15
MSTVLSRIAPPSGSHKTVKRLGRGIGSGLGKTCGKGSKGQKARHGGNFGKLHFQGGQTPLQRRLPKRGFRVPFPQKVVLVNVGSLGGFAAGATVDIAALRALRLVQGRDVKVKILGEGELQKKLTVVVDAVSRSAREKIEKAGGTVVTPEPPAEQAGGSEPKAS